METESKHQSSITLLRAICVTSIIIFHLDKSFFPLGYIGVDLFFVLSGFLITRMIITEIKQDTFGLQVFFRRRYMRLMPAFYFSLLLTLLAIFLTGAHDVELQSIATSSLYSLLFSSNVYFWLTSGYFVETANLLENIHHWSLSVEEQFYFIWPLALLIATKYFKLNHVIFVSFLAILVMATAYLNITYPRPAFYLLPTRVWQFLLGGFTFIHFGFLQKMASKLSKEKILILIFSLLFLGGFVAGVILNQIISILTCMFLCIFLVSKDGVLISRLFNCKPIIWVGLSSYSLYLVHQPILVLIRKLMVHPFHPESWYVPAAFVGITIFGFITYRVEKFFRYKNSKVSFMVLTHICLVLFLVGLIHVIPKTNIESDFADLAKFDYDCERVSSVGCELGDKNNSDIKILLLGNSHARMLIPTFKRSEENLYLLHPDKFSTTLLGGNDDLAIQLKTTDTQKLLWQKEICEMKIFDFVVIAYRYNGYIFKSENINFDAGVFSQIRYSELEKRLAQLATCFDKVIIVHQVPELNFWPRNAERSINSVDLMEYIDRDDVNKKHNKVDQLFQNILSKHENVKLVQTLDLYCNDLSCSAITENSSGHPILLYYDDDHLNLHGSKLIVESIFEEMKVW